MTKQKANIVVIGSSNTDMIIQVKQIPRPGETLLGGKFSTAPGGKGANQAVAAARAASSKTTVTLISKVGKDTLGDQAIAGFKKDKIITDCIFRDAKEPSGVALIFVAADGKNSIGVASGANAALTQADIQKNASLIAKAEIVVMQLETPLETVQAAADIADKAGVPIILNPAPVQKLPFKLLKSITILTPNETEAQALTGITVKNEKTAAQAAAILHKKGVRIVIITMGEKGAYVSAPAGAGFVPATKVKAIDTTAAGDVFNGALSVALSEGRDLMDAVRFASAAATLSVTKLGAQPSIPKRSEIRKFAKTALVK